MKQYVSSFIWLASLFGFLTGHAQQTIDLTPQWDSTTVLENPHKGWFHHLFDEQSTRYPISDPSELNNFPGLNHIYLRVPWAVLEPQDDQYNWAFIDDLIAVWQPQGYTVSLQIINSSPYNDDYEYASPPWLEKLGVVMTRYAIASDDNPERWVHYEPEYDNPVFLAKVREFHEVFAARYGQQPWVEDIDVGSYGDFGEGHTSFSSNRAWPVEAVRELIKIYVDNYPNKPLTVSEDIIFSGDRPDNEVAILQDYIESNDIAYRDNSVLVDYWVDVVPQDQYSVNRPDLFENVWRDHATTVELQHYFATRPANNWVGPNGEEIGDSGISGADILRGAVNLTHATYLGYHGSAGEWLNDNPDISREMANKVGYWFFLNSITLPETAATGGAGTMTFRWENRGVAPAYHPYRVQLRLEGAGTRYDQYLLEANPEQWLPGPTEETYAFSVPSELPAGEYAVKMKMEDESSSQLIALAFSDAIKDADGYYQLGTISLVAGAGNTSPTARATPTSSQGTAPFAVTFDASASTDPDGETLAYSWDFGDGTRTSGASVSHTYEKVGAYVAVLRVTDTQGNFRETTVPVTVTSAQAGNYFTPIPDFTVTADSENLLAFRVDGSGTNDLDGNSDALDYSWDFGDGTTESGVQVGHTYAQPGFYEITLTAADGSTSGIVTRVVKAGDLRPYDDTLIYSTDQSFGDFGNTYDKAFDGDFYTYFDAPEADGAWTGMDLGEPQKITGFAFAPRIDWERRMVGGIFQGANEADFSDAVDLFTIERQPKALEYTYAISGNTASRFRYVRYLGPTDSYGDVAELEFYGDQVYPNVRGLAGYYRIVAKHSNLALTADGGENGDAITQQRLCRDTLQQWHLEAVDGRYYKITLLGSERVIEVGGALPDDGAALNLWDYYEGENQQWAALPTDGEYFYFAARHSDKLITVGGGSTEPGTGAIQYAPYQGLEQQWKLERLPVKPLNLTSMCSDTPEEQRRWRIRNPNRFPVEVQWQVYGTDQQATVMAPPGDSSFVTETCRGPNTTKITWYDARGRRNHRVKASGGASCSGKEKRAKETKKRWVADVRVFPNPAVDALQVRWTDDSGQPAVIRLVDTNGRTVMIQHEGENATHRLSINVQGLRPGLYLLQIDGVSSFRQRVFVE